MDLLFWLVNFHFLVGGGKSQSTNVHPPGYCAGYINRYTHHDQCVYSFTVPKTDMNQCKGLEDTVENLRGRVGILETNLEEMRKLVNLLHENVEAHQKIGTFDERIRQYEQNDVQLREELSLSEAQLNEASQLNREYEFKLDDALSKLKVHQEESGPNNERIVVLESKLRSLHDELKETVTKLQAEKQINRDLWSVKNCTEVNKALPSCDAIRLWGYKKSGYMMIDPDGEGGVAPFQVYCDMDSDDGRGITVVQHTNSDLPVDVVNCEEPGCFPHTINYEGVAISQITALMQNSLACEQHIRYDCFDSKLFRDSMAWWVSRDGRRQDYWGGALPGSKKCACGMMNNCVDPNQFCNCDADDERWLYDEGLITDMEALPVIEVRYGDVSTDKGERGRSSVGPLRCRFDKTMSAKGCDELALAGVRQSGPYMIDPDGPYGPIPPQQQFCEFMAGPIDPAIDPTTIVESGPHTHQGRLDKPTGPNKRANKWTFNDCNAVGRFGPTEEMCNATYAGTSIEHVDFFVKEGMQFFTVPKTGKYKLTATAPGGLATGRKQSAGRGAVVSGIFALTEGDEIRMIVGQKGSSYPGKDYFGGSGGTFVVKYRDWVHDGLVVAGGGGSVGGAKAGPNPDVTDANLSRRGKDSSKAGDNFGTGGEEGHGGKRGNRPAGTNTPGGGAGFMGNGIPSSDTRWGAPEPAISFTNNGEQNEAPGVGGTFFDTNGDEIDGGFGGGGSGSRWAAGGAGGYSGGGGGPDEGHSGGGGSYIHPDADSPKQEVTNFGKGQVIIELVS